MIFKAAYVVIGLLMMTHFSACIPEDEPREESPVDTGPMVIIEGISDWGDEDGKVWGTITGVENPEDYSVIGINEVFSAGYTPRLDQPLIPVKADGSWEIDFTTGGNDIYSTRVAVALLPRGATEVSLVCPYCLPFPTRDDFETDEILDWDEIYRDRPQISWAGWNWFVKESVTMVQPGGNFFSADYVFVDDEGYLHLNIINENGNWICSEVILPESLGYGTYVFQTMGRVDLLDPNTTLSIFTWDPNTPGTDGEMDIEIGRWGLPNNLSGNAQYVVHGFNNNDPYRFQMNLSDNNSELTYYIRWTEGQVEFRIYRGHHVADPQRYNLVKAWSHRGPAILAEAKETPRINLWLANGNPPMNGQDAEIIINSFAFFEEEPDW